MATQALYRTWRPQFFTDMVGQEPIVTTLKNQIATGRVAHAYLFCGSRGTGKTTSAKIFARAVNCENPRDGEPCGECAVCRALADENCLDVVEIDAASNNGVDEIRDLRDKIKYPPQQGKYRVYIIDEVHMLSAGAFNALLKTLEEPPRHALFILATTEPQKLPATVLSRCQRYDFRRIPAQVIAARLRVVCEGEKVEVSDEALMDIARSAEGGMRDALSLMDMCLSYGGGSVDDALVREVLGASDRAFLFRFSDALLRGNAAEAVRGVDELMRGGREPQVFARDLTGHLRALLLAQTCGSELADLLEITAEDAARYQEQAKGISRERLLWLLDQFLGVEADMKWASRPRVALEVAAVRACLPEKTAAWDALASRVDLMEKKLENGEFRAAVAALEPAAKSVRFSVQDPEPKPAAKASAASGAPAAGSNVWDAAMKTLRQDAKLFAFLKNARFAGISGDSARLEFKAGGEIYRNVMLKGGQDKQIEAALTQAAGRPITVELAMESEIKKPAPAAEDALKNIFETFGRENVEVVDE